MKTSGLEELDALDIDWKDPDCFTCFISCSCDQSIVSLKSDADLFDPQKRIQDQVDLTCPFILRYTYGRLR